MPRFMHSLNVFTRAGATAPVFLFTIQSEKKTPANWYTFQRTPETGAEVILSAPVTTLAPLEQVKSVEEIPGDLREAIGAFLERATGEPQPWRVAHKLQSAHNSRSCEICGAEVFETYSFNGAPVPAFSEHKGSCYPPAGTVRFYTDSWFGFGFKEADAARELPSHANRFFRDNGQIGRIYYVGGIASDRRVWVVDYAGFDRVSLNGKTYQF